MRYVWYCSMSKSEIVDVRFDRLAMSTKIHQNNVYLVSLSYFKWFFFYYLFFFIARKIIMGSKLRRRRRSYSMFNVRKNTGTNVRFVVQTLYLVLGIWYIAWSMCILFVCVLYEHITHLRLSSVLVLFARWYLFFFFLIRFIEYAVFSVLGELTLKSQ